MSYSYWQQRRGERRRWDARRDRDLEFAHERHSEGGHERHSEGGYDDRRFADLDQEHDYGGYVEDDEPSRSRFGREYDDESRRAEALRRRDLTRPYPRFAQRAMGRYPSTEPDRDLFVRDYRPSSPFAEHSYGPHRGRGPRNYQRSDERIREDICDQLTDAEFLDASDIEVTVADGDVTLVGTVDDRGGKRYAEDIAEGISGVKNIRNELRVRHSMGGASATRQDSPDAVRTIGERHGSVRER